MVWGSNVVWGPNVAVTAIGGASVVWGSNVVWGSGSTIASTGAALACETLSAVLVGGQVGGAGQARIRAQVPPGNGQWRRIEWK